MGSRRKGRRRIEVFVRTAAVLMTLTLVAAIAAVVLLTGNPDNGEQSPKNDVIQQLGREESDTEPFVEEFQESEEPLISEADMEGSEENPSEEQPAGSEDTPASPTVNENIEKMLNEMSLHDKICQMILAEPEALTGVQTATAAGQMTQDALAEYPVGGVIFFSENLVDSEQTKTMISNMQKYAVDYNGIGLFISVDEEGGRVIRVAQKLGTTRLNPMYEYRDQGTEAAYENAAIIAKDISRFGFNLDFAPVADTWSNPANTVIGERAYSDDYEEAAKLVASAVEGFHSENIMCTLKHFPGHGDTAEDSHKGSAYVYKTMDELWNNELLPFRAGIGAGADMVMVGHITVPEVDSLPASLSSVIITDILREKLEYDGVVITDSLSMNALTDHYGTDKIAVMAVQAGNDILLCQTGMKNMVRALEDAVANGEITEERIDESVRRILELKYEYGLLPLV